MYNLKIYQELKLNIIKFYKASKEAKNFSEANRLIKLWEYWVNRLNEYTELNECLGCHKIAIAENKRLIGYYKWLWAKRHVKNVLEKIGVDLLEGYKMKKPLKHYFNNFGGGGNFMELGLWK